MRKLILFLFTICVGLMQMANAQTITGKVTGADDGAPLPGVNVVVKGSNAGTMTNIDGTYNLEVTGQDAVLVFSFVGFATQEITVGTQTTIDVVMQVDAETKDEVVVVGYGTQKRGSVTGAISSISSKDITSIAVTTADQALQGRAAGVTVINNGSPGTAPTIRIRGVGTMNSNEPLFVIDGVVSNGMGNLNPNDIESLQVLKDASTTAIYGSLGSNGVILITTKKGSSGKVKVDFESYIGQQWNNNRYDLLNVDQYIDYASSADVTAPPAVLTDAARLAWADTKWMDEIFQKGFMQNYNLGVSGGNESTSFRLSMGYVGQEGIMIGTDYERFNLRANSDYKIGKFKIGENLAVSFSNTNPLNSAGGRSLIEHSIKMAPYLPVYNPDNLGGYQGPHSSLDGQDAENPVRVALLNSYVQENLSLIGNIYGEVEIINGLKFRTVAGLEQIMINDNQFEPAFRDDNIAGGATHFSDRAITRKNASNYTSLIFTNSLNYTKTFAGKHNFELLALMEYATVNRDNLNSSSENKISNDIEQVSNTTPTLGSTSDQYRRIGYLGRLNYNYDSKYLFAASIRADASSRFGADNRWGTFPSVAVGWNLSKESFMENLSNISNLKLRGSWGKTGNDQIGNYRYATTLTSDMHYVVNDLQVTGTTPSGPENSALKWEETAKTNIGIDLGLFREQFTLSFEYYKNHSDDLLMNLNTSPSLGIWSGNKAANVGSVETNGVELTLGYNDFEGDFQWSANLNLGTYKNEVLDLGGLKSVTPGGQFEGEAITRLEPGKPLFYFYGWKFDGVFASQAEADAYLNGGQAGARGGDFRVVDVAGAPDANGNPTGPDGIIDANDRTEIGNPYPDLTLGVNLNASYKGFDLNLFIQGSYGNDVCNTNIYDLEGMPRLFNAGTAVMRRWKQDGDITDIPRPGVGRNVEISSRYIEDGSYTRLKNITLGYTLPSKLFKDKISKFRIYVSAQNILTLTNYSGLDPEVGYYQPNSTGVGLVGSQATSNGYPTVNFATGIDYGIYPMPKSFIGGIQITF